MGRAKTNILISQFGKCKEDALEALKIKDDDEAMWLVLVRSRYFVEKWQEGMKYCEEALVKLPKSMKLIGMKLLLLEGIEYEKKCVAQVSTLQTEKEDKKMQIYRNLRGKGVKIGKKFHDMPDSVEMQIKLDKEGKLHFPVVLLYDEFMTSDFI
mmetsp:Transcript_16528/g.28082  ORF Transcript_16528/g.28082 Transcript_16528/m.28082 type:complete len:154 (+) Transcript_16528:466-927(+)